MQVLKRITAVCLTLVFAVVLFTGCSDSGTDKKYDYDLTNYNYSDGIDSNGFLENITASEYVSLPVYKGASVPQEVVTVEEAAIQEQIDMILDEYETYEQITDVAVKDGDSVNIDYVGSVDGVEFDGGSTGGYGTDVTIGVTSYIDDFLEQLIGHMPGETFDVNVTFPDPYQNNPDLAGKDAVFAVTINYIKGDVIEAELTDEIAQNYGFETIADLKADIENWLKTQQESDFFSELILSSELKKDIPQEVMNFVIKADLYGYQNYANMYGVTLDEFVKQYIGYDSVDAYIENNMEALQQSALYCLAVQAIAEQEGLTVTDEDVSDAGVSDYVESYGMPYLKQYVLQTIKVPGFVIDNAVVE